MYRSILLSAAAIVWMAGSVSAQASCGAPMGGKAGVIVKLPRLNISRAEAAPQGYDSIVGMWMTSGTVNGNTGPTSISTWHSDGTEFDNIDLPPISGNICQGVWEQKSGRKVQEHHFGWTFDQNSNPSGYFTMEQTVRLSNNGLKYSGPFDQKFYDNDGNLLGEVTGEISGERFTGQ